MNEQIKQLIGGNVRQLAMVGVLIAEIILFQILTGGTVLSAQNLQNVISGNAYVLILAMGMVLVIIAGHIDLSVGSVAAVVGIVLAMLTTTMGLPWWVGILGGLAVGALIGLWQGFWVAVVGVPAFVVTLAGMLSFRGLNQFIGNSNSIPVPTEIRKLGAGYMNFLPPIEFGNWIVNGPTMVLAGLIEYADLISIATPEGPDGETALPGGLAMVRALARPGAMVVTDWPGFDGAQLTDDELAERGAAWEAWDDGLEPWLGAIHTAA